jgi:hypothetical protein
MESAIIVLMSAMLNSYLNKSLKEDYKGKETYTMEEINESMIKASMNMIKDVESKKQEDELYKIKLPNDLLN